MAITPIIRSIGDEVFNQIKEQIVSNEWPVGSKIPTENELMCLFNVSRVSIRNAVQRLVGMGMLEIRRGDGTYVKSVSIASHLENIMPMIMLTKKDYKEIFEFRKILEVENARLAAKRAANEDIIKMKSFLENMKSNEDNIERYAEDDIGFHICVAKATKNSIIIQTTSVIQEILQKMMVRGVIAVGMKTGVFYHEKIADAIERKDSKGAAKAMKEHLDVSAKILMGEK